MKKLVLAFGFLFALAMFSCAPEQQEDKQTVVSQEVEEPQVEEATGVAVDGAMNSVSLKVGEDTLDFTYPDLEAENRDTWDIDDTVTVRYVVTENGDSVTAVINQSA